MKISLLLERTTYTNKSTIGKLYYRDLQVLQPKFICYTLEDVCRDLNRDGDLKDQGESKIYGETAIPSGSYKVIINQSVRFKTLMPLLLNVEGYEGVRIHPGNNAAATHGCILVGKYQSENWVSESKTAYSDLMRLLKKYEEIEIQIIDQKIIPNA
jgi:hypothetical protein